MEDTAPALYATAGVRYTQLGTSSRLSVLSLDSDDAITVRLRVPSDGCNCIQRALLIFFSCVEYIQYCPFKFSSSDPYLGSILAEKDLSPLQIRWRFFFQTGSYHGNAAKGIA